ncbi:MAG: alkaline phosphatase family protein [Acidimicrobiales bacterium]
MNDRTFSRRQILAGGLAGAATVGAGLAASRVTAGAATVRKAASTKAAGSDLGAVKHVVFLMQENRSFDHYFGTMVGVQGFADTDNRGAFTQDWPGGASPDLLPFHMSTAKQQAECTYDLSHSWAAEHLSWNNGAMDSFVSTHTSAAYEGALGVNTMGYYMKADIPFYYDLASNFTICDRYHCSILGPTHPNRLMAISGTLDPAGVAGGPVLTTNSSLTEFQGTCSWETMPEVLSDAGITWKAYNPYGPIYQPGASEFVSKNMLLYFEQYQDASTQLYQNAFNYCGPNVVGGLTAGVGPNDFAKDVANGTLPQVSWIISPDAYDEHPPAPAALGEWYTQQVLDTLVSNPEVWASTVLFIMYDENDGFFDHVPPPTPPAGTAGEFVTVSPQPTDMGGVDGPLGLGVRVPMIVVSPFSAGGHIVSDVFDHTSQLRFLESLFGVTAPNITAWRRSVTGDLTSTLTSLSTPVTKKPKLPATSASTTAHPVGGECTSLQILELNPTVPPFPVPKKQKIPVQNQK